MAYWWLSWGRHVCTYLAGNYFILDLLCSQVLLERKYCRQKSRIYKTYLLTVIIILMTYGSCNGYSATALAPYFLLQTLDRITFHYQYLATWERLFWLEAEGHRWHHQLCVLYFLMVIWCDGVFCISCSSMIGETAMENVFYWIPGHGAIYVAIRLRPPPFHSSTLSLVCV